MNWAVINGGSPATSALCSAWYSLARWSICCSGPDCQSPSSCSLSGSGALQSTETGRKQYAADRWAYAGQGAATSSGAYFATPLVQSLGFQNVLLRGADGVGRDLYYPKVTFSIGQALPRSSCLSLDTAYQDELPARNLQGSSVTTVPTALHNDGVPTSLQVTAYHPHAYGSDVDLAGRETPQLPAVESSPSQVLSNSESFRQALRTAVAYHDCITYLRWAIFSSSPVLCKAKYSIDHAAQNAKPPPEVVSEKPRTLGESMVSPSLHERQSTKSSHVNELKPTKEVPGKEGVIADTALGSANDAEKFLVKQPYDLNESDTLRLYAGGAPWWKVLIGGCILFAYISTWMTTIVAPFAVLYWLIPQLLALLKYDYAGASGGTFLGQGVTGKWRTPEVVEWSLALYRWMESIWGPQGLLVSGAEHLRTCWRAGDSKQFLSTRRMAEVLRSQVQEIRAVMSALSALGHFSLCYIVGAAYFVFKDWWLKSEALHIPTYAMTERSEAGLWRKCRLLAADLSFAWHARGSAVVFQDYNAFLACGRHGNAPMILCYHPHGLLTLGLTFLTSLPEFEGFRLLAAPALKYIAPLIRLTFSLSTISFGGAGREEFLRYLKRGESCILVPGGIHEATLTEFGKEQIYIDERKGFIKYSLQHGYSLTPVYALGETLLYHQPFVDNDKSTIIGTKHALNSNRLPTVFALGNPLSPLGLLPKRYPVLVIVGRPLKLPMIERPTAEDVDRYHALYVEELRKLYFRYAPSFYKYCEESYALEVPKIDITTLKRARCLGQLTGAPPLLAW